MSLRKRLNAATALLNFLLNQRIKRIKGFEFPNEPHFDPELTPFFVELLKNTSCYLE
jgi:hypothetical protein